MVGANAWIISEPHCSSNCGTVEMGRNFLRRRPATPIKLVTLPANLFSSPNLFPANHFQIYVRELPGFPEIFLKLSLTKYATLVQYDSGRIAKFGLRQPGCRFFYFMAVQIIAYSPDCPSLESMTYELQILQLLCFDIHTNCRGCVPQLYIVFGTVLPPVQEGSVSELVSISGRFWLRVKERSSRRIMSAGKPTRRRLR